MRRVALAFAAFILVAPASAAEIYKLNKTTKGGKELSVASYFRIRNNCEFKEVPDIELNIPPKGGTVCMRSDIVPVRNIWSGKNQHCIGGIVRGVRIIYFPFGSFTGFDGMQFRAMTRTYEAKISVEGGESTTVGASSAPFEPQKAGGSYAYVSCLGFLTLDNHRRWPIGRLGLAGSFAPRQLHRERKAKNDCVGPKSCRPHLPRYELLRSPKPLGKRRPDAADFRLFLSRRKAQKRLS